MRRKWLRGRKICNSNLSSFRSCRKKELLHLWKKNISVLQEIAKIDSIFQGMVSKSRKKVFHSIFTNIFSILRTLFNLQKTIVIAQSRDGWGCQTILLSHHHYDTTLSGNVRSVCVSMIMYGHLVVVIALPVFGRCTLHVNAKLPRKSVPASNLTYERP